MTLSHLIWPPRHHLLVLVREPSEMNRVHPSSMLSRTAWKFSALSCVLHRFGGLRSLNKRFHNAQRPNNILLATQAPQCLLAKPMLDSSHPQHDHMNSIKVTRTHAEQNSIKATSCKRILVPMGFEPMRGNPMRMRFVGRRRNQ